MEWFWIALIAPIIWALNNKIDKYLLSKYFKARPGALVLLSCFVSVIVLPIVFFVQPSVLSIDYLTAGSLILVGFVFVLYFFPYFKALNIEEASRVIPIFQAIPIFTALLGFFILGEAFTFLQLVAAVLVIAGAFGISIDFAGRKVALNKKVLGLMLLSSFVVAISSVLFKFFALKTNFFTSLFWEQIGFLIFGGILLLRTRYRADLLHVLEKNSRKILSISFFNEVLNAVAMITFNFASLLAPIGVVWLIDGLQPFFVLLYGIIVTLFWPKFGKENLSKKHLLQKIFFIILIFIGVALLSL
jgi:drug/metabolite transporter (DMT)-like permease